MGGRVARGTCVRMCWWVCLIYDVGTCCITGERTALAVLAL